MDICELSKWLLLGVVSQDELDELWRYHSSANYVMLKEFIDGASQYGAGNSDKEIEFLEARLPLILYSKAAPIEPDVKFVLELHKDGLGSIRSNVLDIPSFDIARRLQRHLNAQSYRVIRIEK